MILWAVKRSNYQFLYGMGPARRNDASGFDLQRWVLPSTALRPTSNVAPWFSCRHEVVGVCHGVPIAMYYVLMSLISGSVRLLAQVRPG